MTAYHLLLELHITAMTDQPRIKLPPRKVSRPRTALDAGEDRVVDRTEDFKTKLAQQGLPNYDQQTSRPSVGQPE